MMLKNPVPSFRRLFEDEQSSPAEFRKRQKSRKIHCEFGAADAYCDHMKLNTDSSLFLSLSSSSRYFRHSLTREEPAVAPKFSETNGY